MIELHTTKSANGFKASIMLEEVGLPYEVVAYDLTKGEHLSPAYLALNPVGRVPAIVDTDPGDGQPLTVYGSAAILTYLAEKTSRFLPQSVRARTRTLEWVAMVSSDLAPAYSGQFVFNVLAPEKIRFAIDHYDRLCLRLVKVLEDQLGLGHYLAGDEYTIADIITYPVVAISMQRFPGNLSGHPNLARWAQTVGSRAAVQRGMQVPR